MTRKLIGALFLFGNVAFVLHWIETGEPVLAALNAVGAFFAFQMMSD